MKKILQIKEIIKNNSNNVVLFKNISGAFIIKGCSLIVSLFTMPVFISYFGNQSVLGIWFTILSVITWILNFDLGIGNGLRNHLVKSIAEKDEARSRELISSAYVMFGALVLLFVLVSFIASVFVNWNKVFNVSEELVSAHTLYFVVRYIFIGIILQFYLNTISSILYALQKSAINNLISLTISISQLLFVLLAPSGTPQDNLLILSKAYIFLTTVPYLVVTLIVFNTSLKKVSPHFRYFNFRSAKQIISIGGLFFACQIFYMIIANTNEFFITSFTSPQNTVDYSIYNKLFMLAGTLVSLALTPLWSMVTKAIAEKQYDWLNKLYKKAQNISLLVLIAELCLVAVLQIVINLWLGSATIKVNYLYAVIFAIWGTVFVYLNTLSTFACGIGKIKLQAICYSLGTIVKVAFLLVVFRYSDSWIMVVLSNLIILIPYCILQRKALSKYFRLLKEDERVVFQ
jgi:Polysaccharide biosynthesis protein.